VPAVNSEQRRLLRPLVLIAVALAIPILPFLGFGAALEQRMTEWVSQAVSPAAVACLVIGLLAVDILLPVPSSLVSTISGKMLGFFAGTATSWMGMTLGAVVAFWLVRVCGRPLARRFSSDEDLARMDGLAGRFGVLVLVLTRPIPIFAEASVLLMGTTRLSWWKFLIAIGLSNLGISAAYAALGDRAQLPIALAASIILPLLAATIARWFWPGETAKEG
jgi:uncharacterized membrane protein YdjX (TVP38/TMEM64 family)